MLTNWPSRSIHAQFSLLLDPYESGRERGHGALAIRHHASAAQAKAYSEHGAECRKHQRSAAQTRTRFRRKCRGIFHDPFVFAAEPAHHEPAERLAILLRHLDLYEQWGTSKSFQTLKKFFKIYVNSWPGAAELRADSMVCNEIPDLFSVVRSFRQCRR